MKAIVYREYGSAEVLRYADVERPHVADDAVLVRVRAASINRGDLFLMHGDPRVLRMAYGLRRPKRTILGRDIAGTVAAVGSAVTRIRVGDPVFGEMDQLGFAEYVAAPEAFLAVKPDKVTFEQAATLPVAATTALQALRLGEVEAGRSVLIDGASGGVGTFTVQLAKALGAEVTGVCGPRNTDLVRSLGADHVIDYTRDDVTTSASRYDTIVDLAGSHRLSELRRVLAPKGVYVASSGTGGEVLGPLPRLLRVAVTAPFAGRQRLRVLAAKRSIDDLAELADLVATGKITPVIERTYPLGETANAIRRIEAEHARGKYVLTI